MLICLWLCKPFYTSVFEACLCCMPHSISVCFWLISGSCMYLELKTRYSLKVKLLIWTEAIFEPPSFPPPSIFLMLFQLQTFRMRRISRTTYTECTYIYSFFIYLLHPHAFPSKFPLCQELCQIQIYLIGTMGKKSFLLRQSTWVTYQYSHIFLVLSPSWKFYFLGSSLKNIGFKCYFQYCQEYQLTLDQWLLE